VDSVRAESNESAHLCLCFVAAVYNLNSLPQTITSLNAVMNACISGPVPIVTRMKVGKAGNTRPTSTLRDLKAEIVAGTVGPSPQGFAELHFDDKSIIMKFACEGI